MSDFSHLSQLDIKKSTTADLTLYSLAGEPSLTLSPATEANKPYFNAMLKRARKVANAMRAGAMNAAMVARNREEDRDLFPAFVIKGWTNILDSKGKQVEFSKEACAEFIKALPDWIFDEIRNFAASPGNFVEQIDIEEASKN